MSERLHTCGTLILDVRQPAGSDHSRWTAFYHKGRII